MGAVSGSDQIPSLQGDANCRRHGLLADACVDRPVNQVRILELQHL